MVAENVPYCQLPACDAAAVAQEQQEAEEKINEVYGGAGIQCTGTASGGTTVSTTSPGSSSTTTTSTSAPNTVSTSGAAQIGLWAAALVGVVAGLF